MRFLSAIYVVSGLFLATSAAPLPEDGSIMQPPIARDVFVELDLTARNPQDLTDALTKGEVTADRSSGTSGCVVS
ncbi:hypothetical protein C8R43DRAFT_1034992 [Mycena crocata]|nr:hypothetical protein C8R43DRAFT_1034992 [Mycena crocata]